MVFQARPSADSCKDCSQRGLRLFCNLSDEAMARFDRMGLIASFPARTRVFDEGEKVANVFVVCSGRLKLSVTSREGRTMIMRLAGPGDILGLSAALSDQNHEVTAETLEPTQLKSVRRSDFLDLFRDFPEVGQKSARVVAQEYHAVYLDARRLGVAGSASSKVAQLLVEWSEGCGGAQPSFLMTMTHEEIANICGLTRETVTRLLNRFESEGLLVRKGASMKLPDIARLRELAI